MTTMLPARETTHLTPEQLLQRDWATSARWAGIERSYTSADVVNLRGSVVEEQTLARNGAMTNSDALGIPGTLKLISTDVTAIVAICAAARSTP